MKKIGKWFEKHLWMVPILSGLVAILAIVAVGFIGVHAFSPFLSNYNEFFSGISTGVSAVVAAVLVGVIIMQAIASRKQAEASVKMAEETRQQRRPIVVQEMVAPKGFRYKIAADDATEGIKSDCFGIQNVGNGPAIELEMILLNKDKKMCQEERKTFLRADDSPIVFYPSNLVENLNTTCYVLCRYRGVPSSNEAQLWYETWLPFTPVKSQSGNYIYVKPKELEFYEVTEKKSY